MTFVVLLRLSTLISTRARLTPTYNQYFSLLCGPNVNSLQTNYNQNESLIMDYDKLVVYSQTVFIFIFLL